MEEEIELFKKKISKEEKKYQEAVALQNAVSCVLRFEQKVSSLKSAAKKFEHLGEYKDSGERMVLCREQAEQIREEGLRETMALAMSKQEMAKTKSDYADVIAEWKRIVRREEYRDRAKEQIQHCKREIAKIETRAAWKRRLIILVVLLIAIGIACVVLDWLPASAQSGLQENTHKTEADRNFKAISAEKAEYLGMGRLYPVLGEKTENLYYFTTSAKRAYYQIKALVKDETVLEITIYDAAGNRVTEELSLGNQEHKRVALEQEKTYFLRITGSSREAGEILVSEVADDYTNEMTLAQKLSLNREFLVTTECKGDVDYLKLVTNAKDVKYTLNIEPAAGVAAAYEILDENGIGIEGGNAAVAASGKQSFDLPLEAEKTYYIKFSSTEPYCQILALIKETVRTYKLTYHLEGGANDKGNPATYKATDTIALKKPVKKGYLFDGWFVDAEYSKAIYNIGGFGRRDYDLYAKWVKPQPETVIVTSYESKKAGKATLQFQPATVADGYQLRITRIGKKKNYVTYETVKRATIHFTDWKQGQKYYINVRAYINDSCGNRIYGAYSKTEGIVVKKKIVKK